MRCKKRFTIAHGSSLFTQELGHEKRKQHSVSISFSSLSPSNTFISARRHLRLGNDALDVSNALVEDLLQDLGVLKLLLDLGDNGVGQLLLLADLDLALVADPGVKNRLGLVGEVGLLLHLVGLSLELGGFLCYLNQLPAFSLSVGYLFPTHLGNLEQALGDVNDTAEVLDAVDALSDSLGVVLACGVQDVLDLVVLTLGPLLVGGTTVHGDSSVDGKKTQEDDGLLVDDVQLVADGGNGDTGSGGQDGGLAEQVATGQRVEDGLGLVLWGGDVGLEAGLGHGRKGVLKGDAGTRAGGAWRGVLAGADQFGQSIERAHP